MPTTKIKPSFIETGSFTGSFLGTASYAITASYSLNGGSGGTTLTTGSTYPITSSWSNNATSASYSLTASYALNGGSGGTTLTTGSTYPITSSWSNNSTTASYALYAVNSVNIITASLQTGSIVSQTVLYNVTTSQDNTITGLNLVDNKWSVSVVEEWNSGSIAGDDYYNSCSLLLHFSGSNNSTTFIDSSPVTKSLTSNNGAKITSSISKFGGSSLFLDGTDDYVTVANSTDFDFGSGDFTVEYWEYRTSSGTNSPILSRNTITYTPYLIGWNEVASPTTIAMFMSSNGSSWDVASNVSMGTLTTNVWTHYAVTRQSNTFRTFQNGTLISSFTSSATFPAGSGTLQIGRFGTTYYFKGGYVDELRITKGVARYTGSFTTSSVEFQNNQGGPQNQTKYIGLIGGLNDSTVDYGVEKLSDSSLKIRKMSATGQPLSGSGILSASVDRVYVNVIDYTNVSVSASISNAISSSYALTASYALNGGSGGTTLTTGSTYPITASWSNNSLTASYYGGNVTSASYALSASFAPTNTNITASWSNNSLTSSYINLAQSASYYGGSVTSASYSLTASYALSGGGTTLTTGSTYPITASWSNNSISSSYALNGGTTLTTGSVYPITSSWSNNSTTASYALYAVTPVNVITASFQTGSIANQTVLYNVTTSQDNVISGLNLSSNKWGVNVVEEWNSVSIVGDDYYSSCSLLMHFSGSNGSTTFIDNSPVTKSFNTFGNAQISTTQNKFGNSSLYLDGTGDYLTTPSVSNFSFGTGDFTIECWAYRITGSDNGILQISPTAGGFQTYTSPNLAIFSNVNGRVGIYANSTYYISTAISGSTNTWHHYALVRNSGVTKFYFNGNLVNDIGTSGAITDTTNYTGTYLAIGGYYSSVYVWNGYIDELRITKGIARYTSSFATQSAEFPNNASSQQLQTKYIGLVGGLNDSTVDYGVEKLDDTSLKIRKMSVSGQPLSGSGTLSSSVDRVYVNVLDYTNISVSGSLSNAISSSYALTASYSLSGGGTTLTTGSTYPITASWSNNSLTASFVTSAQTASYYNGSVISSSYSLSSSFAPTNTNITASWSNNSLTASYNLNSVSSSFASTASFALNGGGTTLTTGSTYPITSSWSNNSLTASFVTLAQSASYYGGSITSASYSLSSSFAPTNTNITASWAQNSINSQTASFLPVGTYQITSSWSNNSLTASSINFTASNAVFALTSSFALSGGGGTTLTTGSTYPITSSWSVNALTASYLTTGNNYQIANLTASNVSASNSLSSSNVWFSNSMTYTETMTTGSVTSPDINFTSTATTGSDIMFRINTTVLTGSSIALEINASGSQTSYAISASNGTIIGTIFSGSIFNGSFTGSNFGTSSWANNSISASFASTASYALSGGGTTLTTGSTYPITSSWSTNSLTASSINFTASNSTQAQTASYLTIGNSYQITNLTASNISASGFTGSLFGTSSWSINTLTASYALVTSSLTVQYTVLLNNLYDNVLLTYERKPEQIVAITSNDYGTQTDGPLTISTAKNISTDTLVSGRTVADGIAYSVTAITSSASTSNITISGSSAAGIAIGDEVLLINVQGDTTYYSNVGNYEFLRVAGVSTNVVSFNAPVTKVYGQADNTTLGNQKIVLQRVPNYSTVTITSAGSLTANTWSGSTGGIVAFKCDTLINSGSINADGKGFRFGVGGINDSGAGCTNYPTPAPAGNRAESYQGLNSVAFCSRLGASAISSIGGGGGGGGANRTSGSAGSNASSGGSGASGGTAYNSGSSLLIFGGAGGGGGRGINGLGGNGGNGGGIVLIYASNFSNVAFIQSTGSRAVAGTSSDDAGGGGGGGAGGAVLVKSNYVNAVGTHNITGGISGSGGVGSTYGNGGSGGSGGLGNQLLKYTTANVSVASVTASYETSNIATTTAIYPNVEDGFVDNFYVYNSVATVVSASWDSLYKSYYNITGSVGSLTSYPIYTVSSSVIYPTVVRAIVFAENNDDDPWTINTDLKFYLSNNGGVSYTTASLIKRASYEAGRFTYSNDINLTSQNTASLMYKLEFSSSKLINVYGVGLVWPTDLTQMSASISSSYALTASYALNSAGGGGGTTLTTGSSYPITSSWSNNSLTASYLTTTNNYTVSTLNVNSSGSTSSSTNGSLTIIGQNTKGGSNYHDFLYTTNTVAGGVNPNKYFRQDNTGNFEIVNSAYNNTIFTLTDSGSLQLPTAQSANVTQLRNTGAGLKVGNYGLLFDDGNVHLHSTSPGTNIWLNCSGSGMFVVNGQTGASGGMCVGTSIQKGYVTIVGSVSAAITQPYGYLISSGAGTTAGTSPNPYSLTCDNRVMSSEFNVPSDERLKDIKGEISLNKAIDLVTKITPIEFTWKDGVDSGLKAGYSAQQTYKAGFEHLLGVVNRPGLEATTDSDGFTNPKDAQFVMNYEQVTPYHSKLIKHLLDKIEILETRISQLENK